jgi:soluble lytic murein transglycosylase-like protein
MFKPVDVSAVLAKYADNASNYGAANFPLSDHLPMAVVALAAMGAKPARIESWAQNYAAVHELRIADDEERAQREFWRQRISIQGRDAVLAGALPGLIDGIGAAAFHSAIRAGYAVEQNDDRELACALESWQREFLDLPAPATTRTVSVDEALTNLAQSTVRVEPRGLIASRMLAVAKDPGFLAIAQAVPRSSDIKALAIAAAAAFAESGEFTALHVMTGTYALRSLSRFFPDPETAMPAFWRAYAAASLVAGTTPSLAPDRLALLRAEAPTGWYELLVEATAHDDEHVIKSTYTAWRFDETLRDPVFRTAARRYIDQETYR